MKKTTTKTKKLTLNRDTVRHLQGEQLDQVAGGTHPTVAVFVATAVLSWNLFCADVAY